jgi:hypothetical protein
MNFTGKLIRFKKKTNCIKICNDKNIVISGIILPGVYLVIDTINSNNKESNYNTFVEIIYKKDFALVGIKDIDKYVIYPTYN